MLANRILFYGKKDFYGKKRFECIYIILFNENLIRLITKGKIKILFYEFSIELKNVIEYFFIYGVTDPNSIENSCKFCY